jgi:hypothetical protein
MRRTMVQAPICPPRGGTAEGCLGPFLEVVVIVADGIVVAALVVCVSMTVTVFLMSFGALPGCRWSQGSRPRSCRPRGWL